jgi:hypothetical protein
MERPTMPKIEEEEEEEDQIDEQRNEGMLIDATSEKTSGKEPMSLDDPSADKVFDEEPHRKTIKLLVNYPRSSPTAGSALDKETHKKPYKLVLKYSISPPEVGSRSSNIESHKAGPNHVGSEFVAGSESSNDKASLDTSSSSLGYLESSESLLSADRDFWYDNVEVPELPGVVEIGDSLSKTCLEAHGTGLRTAKEMGVEIPDTRKMEDNSSRKRKLDSRWVNKEDMLSSLTDSPQVQMEAICSLYRQGSKTREKTTIRLSDTHYAKYVFLFFFFKLIL